ncbi:hypothetical protein NEFER03_0760 [Nematocida sp. LUAm3]|nr:hypothetical protein NEFER03_0760 [Nematocida sp. LUAm3]KAI5175219.1 hypothetical protein NEFER02_1180 [Nematocida sp. LUAm2]KAI5178109.1 hypothetical protein NEFER01_1287 [Nematocida sp. LUAm1]
MDLDLIFMEPYEETYRGVSEGVDEEFVLRRERVWKKALERRNGVEESLLSIKEGRRSLEELLYSMNRAKEEIRQIESTSVEIEREIENKRRAKSILDELVERVCIPKEYLSALSEPWLESTEELRRIEEAIGMVERLKEIDNQKLLSIYSVQEGVKEAETASFSFIRNAERFFYAQCHSLKKRSPGDLHELLSRYAELFKFLRRNNSINSTIDVYSEIVRSMYIEEIKRKSKETVKLFERTKRVTEEKIKKLEENFYLLIKWILGLLKKESIFLSEVLIGENRKEKERVIDILFKEAHGELPKSLEATYHSGWTIPVINLLKHKEIWSIEVNEKPVEKRVDILLDSIKATISHLKEKFLLDTKKRISKEYSKEGALDIDKTFYDLTEYCADEEINTEIVKLNINYGNKLITAQRNKKDILHPLIKQACILSNIQAFFLKNKSLFTASLEDLLNEETKSISEEILRESEKKVFEKEKLSSILKRIKEILEVLKKLEDPLAHHLQVDFKDMLLTKAAFHQKNDIAKVLT